MSTGSVAGAGNTVGAALVDHLNLEEYLSMGHLRKWVADFVANEDGPTAVEYAVMLSLIIVVCIAAIATLGSNANNTFSYVGGQLGKTGS